MTIKEFCEKYKCNFSGICKKIKRKEKEHIRKRHPNMKIISSTCKQIRDLPTLESELEKDYSLVVLDYNYNNDFDTLAKIPHKDKCEILVNAACTPNCQRRGEHYRYIGKYQLEHCDPAELAKIQAGTAKIEEWQCPHMKNNAFTRRNSPLHVSPQAIYTKYVPMGYNNFKLEGRGNIFPDLAELQRSFFYFLFYLEVFGETEHARHTLALQGIEA